MFQNIAWIVYLSNPQNLSIYGVLITGGRNQELKLESCSHSYIRHEQLVVSLYWYTTSFIRIVCLRFTTSFFMPQCSVIFDKSDCEENECKISLNLCLGVISDKSKKVTWRLGIHLKVAVGGLRMDATINIFSILHPSLLCVLCLLFWVMQCVVVYGWVNNN